MQLTFSLQLCHTAVFRGHREALKAHVGPQNPAPCHCKTSRTEYQISAWLLSSHCPRHSQPQQQAVGGGGWVSSLVSYGQGAPSWGLRAALIPFLLHPSTATTTAVRGPLRLLAVGQELSRTALGSQVPFLSPPAALAKTAPLLLTPQRGTSSPQPSMDDCFPSRRETHLDLGATEALMRTPVPAAPRAWIFPSHTHHLCMAVSQFSPHFATSSAFGHQSVPAALQGTTPGDRQDSAPRCLLPVSLPTPFGRLEGPGRTVGICGSIACPFLVCQILRSFEVCLPPLRSASTKQKMFNVI